MTGVGRADADLDALSSVTRRLLAADSEQEVCDIAVEAVPTLFDVPFGGLWLYDAEASELQMTATTDEAARRLDSDVVYRPGNSLSWAAFESGDVRRYTATDTETKPYNDDSTVGSELILPLGEHGVLNVAAEETDAFDQQASQVGHILAATVEAALSKAQREHALEVQRDRLEEFVSMVSHDLRNPLTVADGNLELALTTGESDYLTEVADALDRMDTLIEDLLTLAKKGYVVEDRTRFDLDQLAEEAWSNVHTPDGTLQIDGSVTIFGDKSRLLQVFENLFRNSVEHGSTGNRDTPRRDDSVEHGSTSNRTQSDDSAEADQAASDDEATGVTIRVGPLESLHTSTRVSEAEYDDGFYIADDGPGIPADQRSSVFDSGHSTDGTGLGLAIVSSVVEAHGWTITAGESVQGGARFEVTGAARPVTPFEGR